jgi:LPS export ABC transporter protein LptC
MLLLGGCAGQPISKEAPEPFVFRSLNLRQQDKRGAPAWELTSPEARYDINRRLAQVRQPRGVIYLNGKPRYSIAAQSGTVLGDGEAIQLEGAVAITLLGQNPVRISGDQVRWLPRQDLMLIDRRPTATDRRSRLSARTARFLIQDDRIELRGSPTLQQWDGRLDKGPAAVVITTTSVDWKPGDGGLVAKGPVRGERRNKQPASGQLLMASALSGNLRAGYVDLLAPVRVDDRRGKGWIQAERTRWLINDERLRSEQPFRGQINKLTVDGGLLDIDLKAETVLIPQACGLRQPDQTLTADSCQWHWPDGRFEAKGNVALQRQAYKQITRSSRLQGRLGEEGVAVFSSPGARVQSRFTLPPRSQGKGRRKPATPVEF